LASHAAGIMIPIGFVWPTVSDPFRIFIARPMSTCPGRHTHRLKTLNRGASARVSCAPGPPARAAARLPEHIAACAYSNWFVGIPHRFTSAILLPARRPVRRMVTPLLAAAPRHLLVSTTIMRVEQGGLRPGGEIFRSRQRGGVSRRAVGLPRASGRHQPPRPRWQSSRLWHQQPMSPAAT
jgi:hypothetical protein